MAGEACLRLSQEALGSWKHQSTEEAVVCSGCPEAGVGWGGLSGLVPYHSSSEGRAGGGSIEALGRILLCVHCHCVPATCKELPEAGTMRRSNFDSKELHFEYTRTANYVECLLGSSLA